MMRSYVLPGVQEPCLTEFPMPPTLVSVLWEDLRLVRCWAVGGHSYYILAAPKWLTEADPPCVQNGTSITKWVPS